MRLTVTRLEGLQNDLLVRIERSEIDRMLLSVANRAALLSLPGIPRHRPATPEETRALADARMPIERHLAELGVVDSAGRARRRVVAITNRNLGANHGHVAWQRHETPHLFRVREDPGDQGPYTCVTVWRDGRASIEDLWFDFGADRVRERAHGPDLSDEIEWATSGPRILRAGRPVSVAENLHQFYDARHVFAFDDRRDEGQQIRAALYRDYPSAFAGNMRRAWAELGVPRARYFHGAVGCSGDAWFVVQREGTIEELAEALREAGATEGLLLDNGGSSACWAWWVNDYAGGLISPTVDYRPPGTSALAFVLTGAAKTDLPWGSVSYSTY